MWLCSVTLWLFPREGVAKSPCRCGSGSGIYKLICRNEEKLKSTMTDEQKELFEKYTDCVREHQANTDCLIFKNGFKLGARMMLEVMEES